MRKHIYIGLTATLAVSCLQAEVVLTVERVQQRYPWDGKVDVDYSVSGFGDGAVPVDWRVEFALDAVTNGVPVHVPLTCFDGLPTFDLPLSSGTHRVTWLANEESLGLFATNATLSAALVYDPVREADADYLIVTLPKAADAWSVRFVRAPTMPSSVFNVPEYKTGKLVLKRVPHGEFWMGTGDVSSGTSRHRVRLTEDFFLGVFELTDAQWNRIVSNSASGTEFAKSNVDNVTLFKSSGPFSNLNARVFHAAGSVTNAVTGFNLPSEAQWEYACRAGWDTARFYNLSDTDLREYARFNANASSVSVVGLCKPNPWGFYDILGNVWERVYGTNNPYPGYSETEVTENPVVLDVEGTYVGVMRGSAYTGASTQMQCGIRGTLNAGPYFSNTYAHPNSGLRLMKRAAAGEHVTPVTNATASLTGVAVDFSGARVRKVLKTEEILPVAWNSGRTWPAGGAAGEATLLAVTCSSTDVADTSTWSEGSSETLLTASGEGVYTWCPVRVNAYKLVWLVGGERCGEAYFDCTETSGLQSGKPIDGATVYVPPQCPPATGDPVFPAGVTVTLGGLVLREGVDYVLMCSDNLAPGAATVTAHGTGEYSGTASALFTIGPSQAEDLAQAAVAAVEPGDFTTNAWRTVRVKTLVHNFTYSQTNFTGCAGTTADSRAVVSVAPMAPGLEGDLTTWTVQETERRTLADRTDEGAIRWKPVRGVWQAHFDIVTGTKTNHSETAIFDLRRLKGGMFISIQ